MYSWVGRIEFKRLDQFRGTMADGDSAMDTDKADGDKPAENGEKAEGEKKEGEEKDKDISSKFDHRQWNRTAYLMCMAPNPYI